MCCVWDESDLGNLAQSMNPTNRLRNKLNYSVLLIVMLDILTVDEQ